eukprot:3125287-Karenia_brevis.AAC.1
MLSDLQRESSKHGLELHPSKTKILSNLQKRRGSQRQGHIIVDGMEIEILPYSGFTKYLGRKFTFDDQSKVELQQRLAAAWGKFNVYRQELTSKTYPLKERLRLFDATITATVLYGSASWTLTQDSEMLLERTQRRMLRLIIGTTRRQKQPPTEQHQNTQSTQDQTNVTTHQP